VVTSNGRESEANLSDLHAAIRFHGDHGRLMNLK
jgi:hypothetical protein